MEILRLVSSSDNSGGNSITSQLCLWPLQRDLIVVARCADTALFQQNDAYPLTANVVLDVMRVFSGCVLLNQPPEHLRCGCAGHSVCSARSPWDYFHRGCPVDCVYCTNLHSVWKLQVEIK